MKRHSFDKSCNTKFKLKLKHVRLLVEQTSSESHRQADRTPPGFKEREFKLDHGMILFCKIQ
jgi:hypothetical protein